MKQQILFLLCLLCATTFSYAANNATDNLIRTKHLSFFSEAEMPRWSAKEEALVKDRLEMMISPVELKFDKIAKENIQAYTTYGYRGTEKMLGNSVLYFPMFEDYLRQYSLPQQLKYLPLVESQLNPHAVSNAGAVGLWQFMPETARELGLSIGTYSDERRDPNKATEAAVRHLKRMYDSFGSWELAITAYNCGAGNVRKAIRLSGSEKFSKLKKFLPRESQQYLPRFVAASYIAENFHLHGLRPDFPDYGLLMTSTVKLYSSIPFKKIAGLSGVSLEDIKKLNPAYLRGIIPASSKGNYLILPEIGMTRLQSHLKYSDIRTNIPSLNAESGGGTVLRKVTYTVKRGDTLGELAHTFQCSADEVRAWNNLRGDNIYQNQVLAFYVR